ncbi:MAG: type VI secretion system ImpA family N-terminal domain-containing protein, partial [Planctomycetia bacterium]
MTSELDFQQLLQPISEESAVGQDLRTSGDPSNLYRQVRDARSSARDREQRDDRGDDRAADEASAIEQWQKTSTLAQKYLQTVGKDLEVVACLLEAQVRVNGLGGLSAVIELSAGLIDRYWGQLYPLQDEDGYETTMLPLSRLNSEAIIYPLQRLQISETSGAEVLLVWQTDQAQRVE